MLYSEHSPNVVWFGETFFKSTVSSTFFGLFSGAGLHDGISGRMCLKSFDFCVLRRVSSWITWITAVAHARTVKRLANSHFVVVVAIARLLRGQ